MSKGHKMIKGCLKRQVESNDVKAQLLSQRNPSLALFKVRILNNPVGLISCVYSSGVTSISADVKIMNNYIITNNIIGHKSNNNMM